MTEPVAVSLQTGPGVVAVSVATLWRAPDRVRAVDAPALDAVPAVRTWAARLTDDEQRDLDGRTDSQLLLGDPVLVEEVTGAWARVIAIGQASSRDERGYPGWIPAAHLAGGEAATPTHVVAAVVTAIHAEPDGPVAVPDIGLGTAVSASGPDRDGWLPIRMPDGATGWIASQAVEPVAAPPRAALAAAPATSLGTGGPAIPGGEAGCGEAGCGEAGSGEAGSGASGVAAGSSAAGSRAGRMSVGALATPGLGPVGSAALDVAAQLLGVRYIWGGVSPFGIDCSGLVYLAYRRLGVNLPRDAHDQAAATEPVAPGDERPGDVYLFARPGRKVHHVGLVAAPPAPDGTRLMLHASGSRRVVEEPLSPERLATLVGVQRVVPA